MSKVCVLGLGYIGLPTASVLATNGFDVVGVDVSPHVVDTVNRGGIHIEEPGLNTLVQAATGSGKLRAATDPEPADVFIIAVPTPLTAEKCADMTYVRRATKSIVPHLKPGDLIVLESTSPPGTCRDLLKPILDASGHTVGEALYLAHCPERVLPGKILKELIENDRIVGGYDPTSAEKARALYAEFVEGDIFLTDATAAEMVKLLENTYRDVNIALANEAAVLCERQGIDFAEVRTLANRHPRVNIHAAGPGVGGHCISVDPWFLVEQHRDHAELIHLARRRNDSMPEHVVEVLVRMLGDQPKPVVAALGLAYKGNVDDVRESPAVRVIERLKDKNVTVRAFDPHVDEGFGEQCALDAAVDGADCIVVLTDHDEFKTINPGAVRERMRHARAFDTRACIDAAAWRSAGFDVRILGLGHYEGAWKPL